MATIASHSFLVFSLVWDKSFKIGLSRQEISEIDYFKMHALIATAITKKNFPFYINIVSGIGLRWCNFTKQTQWIKFFLSNQGKMRKKQRVENINVKGISNFKGLRSWVDWKWIKDLAKNWFFSFFSFSSGTWTHITAKVFFHIILDRSLSRKL